MMLPFRLLSQGDVKLPRADYIEMLLSSCASKLCCPASYFQRSLILATLSHYVVTLPKKVVLILVVYSIHVYCYVWLSGA